MTELEKLFAFEAYLRGWLAGATRDVERLEAPEWSEGYAVGRRARKVFAEHVAAKLDLTVPEGEKRC